MSVVVQNTHFPLASIVAAMLSLVNPRALIGPELSANQRAVHRQASSSGGREEKGKHSVQFDRFK